MNYCTMSKIIFAIPVLQQLGNPYLPLSVGGIYSHLDNVFATAKDEEHSSRSVMKGTTQEVSFGWG